MPSFSLGKLFKILKGRLFSTDGCAMDSTIAFLDKVSGASCWNKPWSSLIAGYPSAAMSSALKSLSEMHNSSLSQAHAYSMG